MDEGGILSRYAKGKGEFGHLYKQGGFCSGGIVQVVGIMSLILYGDIISS